MASKNLPAAGEGGLLTTDDDQIWTRILGLASQGMNPWDETVGGPRRIAYQLGFNFRPTPTSFAFAWSHLTRLTRYQRARDARVAAFEQALGDAPLFAKPHVPEGSTHAWQMYRLLVDPEAIGLGPQHAPHVRDAVMFLVRGEGGMCGLGRGSAPRHARLHRADGAWAWLPVAMSRVTRRVPSRVLPQ
ncbi:MAG: DegT/DnrJ/EryC1/StrS family aminotransferase [Deltaproteobacteria bacterium]|nr:DegT/DnrJ/EryC1/StrS family aminotransferase [Deltaproteobacteria bacterium]